MKKYDLISNYTFKLKKPKQNRVNSDDICNVINQEFNSWAPLEVVVSDLRRIKLFHTDRDSEFKNFVIEGILNAFGIDRSLSSKGSTLDNVVAESMYSIIKIEFAFEREFASFNELELLWFDYVNWYNNVRIHGSLGYKSPVEFAIG